MSSNSLSSEPQIEPQAMAILVSLAKRVRQVKRDLRRRRKAGLKYTLEEDFAMEVREYEAWNALQESKNVAIDYHDRKESESGQTG